MKVTVTAEHIANGVCRESDRCPIALALPQDGFPSVGCTNIYLTLDGKRMSARIPPKAMNFMRAFDQKEPVEPFSFELSADDWTQAALFT